MAKGIAVSHDWTLTFSALGFTVEADDNRSQTEIDPRDVTKLIDPRFVSITVDSSKDGEFKIASSPDGMPAEIVLHMLSSAVAAVGASLAEYDRT